MMIAINLVKIKSKAPMRTATTTVTVSDVPILGLAATHDSPTELGSPTTLTATITAGSNVTYTWSYGDGATDSGAVVIHTYSSIGSYAAMVTATNSVGAVTDTALISITDVSITGRKRRRPVSRMAWVSGTPARTRRFMKSISTMESLTTTPVSATMPKRLKSVTGRPITK